MEIVRSKFIFSVYRNKLRIITFRFQSRLDDRVAHLTYDFEPGDNC